MGSLQVSSFHPNIGYYHVAWKEPPAARRVSYLPFTNSFWGIFLVVYQVSKPSKLIYCVGSYYLQRAGRRFTAPLHTRFQREIRNFMSLLNPLISVHLHTHSSTQNIQQRTCCIQDTFWRSLLMYYLWNDCFFVFFYCSCSYTQKSFWFSCFYRHSLLFSVAGV